MFRKPVTQRFTVALVVDPGRERHALVRNFLGVAENVDSAAADGGEKNLVEGQRERGKSRGVTEGMQAN